MTFCVWLLSRSIKLLRSVRVVRYSRVPRLPMAESDSTLHIYHICLSSYQVMDSWIVYTFWLLWVVLLPWTFMCKSLFAYPFSILWGRYLGSEIAGSDINSVSLFEELTDYSLLKMSHFTLPSAMEKASQYLPILTSIFYFLFLWLHPFHQVQNSISLWFYLCASHDLVKLSVFHCPFVHLLWKTV